MTTNNIPQMKIYKYQNWTGMWQNYQKTIVLNVFVYHKSHSSHHLKRCIRWNSEVIKMYCLDFANNDQALFHFETAQNKNRQFNPSRLHSIPQKVSDLHRNILYAHCLSVQFSSFSCSFQENLAE